MMIWLERYKTILIGGVVVCIGLFLFISGPKEKISSSNATAFPVLQADQNELLIEEEVDMNIFIDVKGAVKIPGMYWAVEGERVFDIIQRAGGLMEGADEGRINYAQKLVDEMVVYIPKIGEIQEEQPFTNTVKDKGNGKVNLNNADSAELETLPGIGPSKAKAILDFREENGPFKQIEDLQKVTGIGAKSFEKLQDLITVR